jgi:hypothetical protein
MPLTALFGDKLAQNQGFEGKKGQKQRASVLECGGSPPLSSVPRPAKSSRGLEHRFAALTLRAAFGCLSPLRSGSRTLPRSRDPNSTVTAEPLANLLMLCRALKKGAAPPDLTASRIDLRSVPEARESIAGGGGNPRSVATGTTGLPPHHVLHPAAPWRGARRRRTSHRSPCPRANHASRAPARAQR